MNSVELYGITDTLPEKFEKVRIKKIYLKNISQYSNALKTASEAFQEGFDIFNDPKFETKEDWKKEVESDGTLVYSKHFKFGKTFSLKVNFF